MGKPRKFQKPILKIGSKVKYLGRKFKVLQLDHSHVVLASWGVKTMVSRSILERELLR